MPSPLQRSGAVVGLLLVLAGVGYALTLIWQPNGHTTTVKPLASSSEAPVPKTAPKPVEFFQGQPRPDLVLVLSGQMYAYLQPCGCARPQLGGLERRFEMIQQLRAKGWPVSAADLGDLAAKHNDKQARLKFETSLQALQAMKYAAVCVGRTEITLSLEEAFAVGLNYQPPMFLCANLLDKDGQFPEMFRPWTIDEPAAGLRVGYVGVVGDGVAEELRQMNPPPKPLPTFAPAAEGVAVALEPVQAQKPDLLVLLFHGSRAEAQPLAKKFPQFRVILTLDDSDEPAAIPEKAGETLLISLGHKGKYVGLVGAYRRNDGWELRYELAAASEYFELPDSATNPVREKMRDYVRSVYRDDFLTQWPRSSHPLQLDLPEAKYVGAAKCQQCHPKTFAIWSATRHAHAYENLAKDGRPVAVINRKNEPPLSVGRQHDPECARCHTTGFDFKTGYVTEQTTPHLRGNQCENCHGPASLHVENPRDAKFSMPLRRSIGNAEYDCRKCHDGDNDPKFKLDEYWSRIRHGRE